MPLPNGALCEDGGWLVGWWLAWSHPADGLGMSGQWALCVTAKLMMAKG